jgi:hypothetical protein
MVQYYYAIFLNGEGEIVGWVNPGNYGNNPTMLKHITRGSQFENAVEGLLTENGFMYGTRLVWAGDYAEREEGHGELNLYKLCKKSLELVPEESDVSYYRYLVNHTKGQFIDKDRADKYTNLNPLPLLTAEGNGFGLGDYSSNHRIVGYWSRDCIEVMKKKPEDYIELVFDLA